MKWGLAFGIFAAAGVWGAAVVESVWGRVLLSWLSLAFLGLALAYGLRAPRLLLKRRDGRLGAWSWLAFWPYHLGSHLSLALYRLSAREAPFHEIGPGLFLGSCLRPRDALRLGQPGTVAVLDLTSEFTEIEAFRRSGRYCWLPVMDHTAPSRSELESAVRFILEHLGHPPVFVHCAVGHGRSAMVVAAFLLSQGSAATPQAAVACLKSKRPGVRINTAQMNRLREFAGRLPNPHERRDL
jgi:hypothetical protein